jgi:hypothetical protein
MAAFPRSFPLNAAVKMATVSTPSKGREDTTTGSGSKGEAALSKARATSRSKRRKVTRDYSSSDDDSEYVPSSQLAPKIIVRRDPRPVAPLPLAPRYLGDESPPPSDDGSLTAPYRTRANAHRITTSTELDFQRESQMESDEQDYYFSKTKGAKRVNSPRSPRKRSRRRNKTFLRTIAYTSFAPRHRSESETDAIEEDSEPAGRNQRTVTSGILSRDEIAKLIAGDSEEEVAAKAPSLRVAATKNKPVPKGFESRYGRLEMIEEDEFEEDCR